MRDFFCNFSALTDYNKIAFVKDICLNNKALKCYPIS